MSEVRSEPDPDCPGVLRFADADQREIITLLARFKLDTRILADQETIPGSFWGDDEAGLVGRCLYLRQDTPVHSILHEAGHFICMDETRRKCLDTDAKSDDQEESAVCFLQILLSQYLTTMGVERMLADMDTWGYSFRLGSSRDWYKHDAEDARDWLLNHGLIDAQDRCLFHRAFDQPQAALSIMPAQPAKSLVEKV